MPYEYQGEAPVPKIFVLICHEVNSAICFKATSQVSIYANNTALRAGVVFYASGDIPFLPVDTAIQPDNPHPIAHADINRCMANGTFEPLGTMPDDFAQKLVSAINASITMKPVRKKNFLARL